LPDVKTFFNAGDLMPILMFFEILLAISIVAIIYGLFAGKLMLKGNWTFGRKEGKE
jgi:hypothetical protein